MVLSGKRVFIRPITLDDCEEYVEWRNSPFVNDNFIVRKYTVEQQTKWINSLYNSNEAKQFIILTKNVNEKLGSVYLINIDLINRKAEFGIFLKSNNVSGKGFGKEATDLMISYGFNVLNLNKIYLRVFADNISAINLYTKCGFVREGYAEEDVFVGNRFRDMLFMAILKRNYLKKNQTSGIQR